MDARTTPESYVEGLRRLANYIEWNGLTNLPYDGTEKPITVYVSSKFDILDAVHYIERMTPGVEIVDTGRNYLDIKGFIAGLPFEVSVHRALCEKQTPGDEEQTVKYLMPAEIVNAVQALNRPQDNA
ncbi:hypothetical protein [Herbidospora mongoliensis]|uniref:hypothetical protein n=1 Tax=Herbidospora mongoliensis TaxID=688067 RepID=UPI000836825E|nr:hypothetical protein [Herbidospora mongoliensis]